jgi:hypothetical protein
MLRLKELVSAERRLPMTRMDIVMFFQLDGLHRSPSIVKSPLGELKSAGTLSIERLEMT